MSKQLIIGTDRISTEGAVNPSEEDHRIKQLAEDCHFFRHLPSPHIGHGLFESTALCILRASRMRPMRARIRSRISAPAFGVLVILVCSVTEGLCARGRESSKDNAGAGAKAMRRKVLHKRENLNGIF